MPWVFLLLALAAFAIAFKTSSLALAAVCVLIALGLLVAWALGLLSQRVGSRSRDESMLIDPQELRRLRKPGASRSAMTVLSVNINKVAVLRNSRGGHAPDVVRAARTCLDAGAHGITVHPRPDARHIRSDDVLALAALCHERGVEFNLEGNPFAPPRAGYPGFEALCAQARPAQATLVPDSDAQLTSDHGFDFARDGERLRPRVAALKALGCRVSLFVDVGDPDVAQAARVGADRVELYTGPYAEAAAKGPAVAALAACAETARRAQMAGLGVNAGHDLSQGNLRAFLASVPAVLEVSIGHALIDEALYAGLDATVRAYMAILKALD